MSTDDRTGRRAGDIAARLTEAFEVLVDGSVRHLTMADAAGAGAKPRHEFDQAQVVVRTLEPYSVLGTTSPSSNENLAPQVPGSRGRST